jgi:hypothetical protein
MTIPYIIFYLTLFIWLFPVFKQYRTPYFYTFLIYGLNSIVSFVAIHLVPIKNQLINPIFTMLIIFSLIQKSRKNIIIILISTTILIAVEFKIHDHYSLLINAVLHSVILFIILLHFTKAITEENIINLFLVLFIAYEISHVLKNLVVFSDLVNGIVLFYITTFFQIFFGVMFIFININTKKYSLGKLLKANV